MTEPRFYQREIETMSRDELDAMQLQKLLEMLEHVARTNPFYANFWKQAGIDVSKVKSFEDFRLVPMIEKSHIVADQNEHPPFGSRSGSVNQNLGRTDLYTTSGTSGQGKELHACSLRELKAMEEIYRYGMSWAGMSPGDIVLLTLPITMLAGGRVEYQGAVASDLTVLPVGNYDAASKVDHIRRFNPKALFGSTSYFGTLATMMGDDARASSVDTLLTGLEGASLPFLKSIEEMWGAKAYDRFGCANMRADFMWSDENGIGEPGKPGTLLNVDPYVLMEVVDPTTGLPVGDGEFGELVITSLYHLDNPAIRNRVRDGAVFQKGGRKGSIRNFHGVEMASISRIDDVKKVKGINIYPQAVDDLVFSWPEIEQYEVILSRSSSFADIANLRLQLRSSVAASSAEQIIARAKDAVKTRLGINFNIEIVPKVEVSDYKARRWKDLR
ncbi:phenylacetate--CoA ligase family protein [Rhizobium sp. 16-449-1b]|uniref:phenylacetate--CoA ligase family protein n=1 Tax=Rhizobium sp. 16-449-1b TaxID=2819989 RepID=UPI001ADB45A6|nr:AMP-binding protein [Rhizobium sp. 16-449-1b]MBO9195401.1 phenylacetate--CoA ligase family protein [Rhizobium sp. 16-449-1b]